MNEQDDSRNYDEILEIIRDLHKKYPPVSFDSNNLFEKLPDPPLTWDHLNKNLSGGFKRGEISLIVTTPYERKSNFHHHFFNNNHADNKEKFIFVILEDGDKLDYDFKRTPLEIDSLTALRTIDMKPTGENPGIQEKKPKMKPSNLMLALIKRI